MGQLLAFNESGEPQQTYSSLRELHARLLGPQTAWSIDAIVALTCFMSCIAYLDFASDLICPTVDDLLGDLWRGRPTCIIALGIFVLLPLCLLKEITALAPFSFMGNIAVIFVVGMMVLRAMDGSYIIGGQFRQEGTYIVHPDILRSGYDSSGSGTPASGWAETHESIWRFNISTLRFVNMISVGFLSHYNVSEYYFSLTEASPNRFRKATGYAFLFTAIVYMCSMSAGYSTFGKECDETILRNYSAADPLAGLAKIAIAASLLTSFPLMFKGLYRSVKSLYSGSSGIDKNMIRHEQLVVVLLLFVCCTAVVFPDVGAIVNITGAFCGTCLCYVLPLIFIFAKKSNGEC